MELITAIVIIVILALLAMPIMSSMQARSEKLRCTSNLKSLHVAVDTYLKDNDQWPQIPMTQADDKNFANNWIKALDKYSIGRANWICPTIQRTFGAPDFEKPEHTRIDYTPMPFDRKPSTPRKWVNHPWFVEKGAPHGKGNLIIYADGRIEELNEVRMVH